MNVTAVWIATGVFLFGLVASFFVAKRKKTWCKVYLANEDVIEGYRTGWDRLWRSDEAGIMVFHTADGVGARPRIIFCRSP